MNRQTWPKSRAGRLNTSPIPDRAIFRIERWLARRRPDSVFGKQWAPVRALHQAYRKRNR